VSLRSCGGAREKLRTENKRYMIEVRHFQAIHTPLNNCSNRQSKKPRGLQMEVKYVRPTIPRTQIEHAHSVEHSHWATGLLFDPQTWAQCRPRYPGQLSVLGSQLEFSPKECLDSCL
jgi:hypothetical protein